MNITTDDPRLTAYAIGESDAAEATNIEAIMQDSADHLHEVNQIKLIAGLLRAEFSVESLLENRPTLKRKPTQRHSRRIRVAVVAAAALILLAAIWSGLYLMTAGPGTSAFAQAVAQVTHAKSISWKSTFYTHASSKDGTTWLVTETRQVDYKAPGLYRETWFDDQGQPRSVEITDAINRRQLSLDLAKKKGWLTERALVVQEPEGPFTWELKDLQISNLQWVHKQKTATGEVNIFRNSFWDASNGRRWSYDFWIDTTTKRLVEVHVPGEDIYDPEKDLVRNNKPGKWRSMTTEGGGHIDHDIQYDLPMEDSLFSLQPPAGYQMTTVQRPTVTEKEAVDYLRIIADYNDKTFPDQVFPSYIFPSDRLNKIWDKPTKDRTPAEQKLLDTDSHYKNLGLDVPIHQYLIDNIVEGTFRYLGKGVKLGDKDRIVCWYKPKDTQNYHVVYGDLSVKDMAADALPLPTQP